MATIFRASRALGKVAIFTEPSTVGDPADINAPRNAPLKSPAANLAHVHLHTDLDSMEVAFDRIVTIAHAKVAGRDAADDYTLVQGVPVINAYRKDTVLLTHNLGYLPHVKAAVGKNAVVPGFPVQTVAGGAGRFVTIWVTTTKVMVSEYVNVLAADLPAISVAYHLLVFRQPPAQIKDAAGHIVLVDFGKTRTRGVLSLAGGRFRSDRAYLQVVAGGTPFDLPSGKTIDANNGAPRIARPDGTTVEIVGANVQGSVEPGYAFGAPMNYKGTFTASPAIKVQAPAPGASSSAASGLFLSASRLRVVKAGANIVDTAGKMVCLLPAELDITKTLSFPDLTKDIVEKLHTDSTYDHSTDNGIVYRMSQTDTTWVSAMPQEKSVTTVLASVPAGADFFLQRVRLTRTKAPSPWLGRALNPLVVTGEWIAWDGSAIVEMDHGITRLIHIVMQAGKLVAILQQSVTTAPGGFGRHGSDVYSYKKVPGTKVFFIATASWGPNNVLGGVLAGQEAAASQVDTTDYASTYKVEIQGQFGRRS